VVWWRSARNYHWRASSCAGEKIAHALGEPGVRWHFAGGRKADCGIFRKRDREKSDAWCRARGCKVRETGDLPIVWFPEQGDPDADAVGCHFQSGFDDESHGQRGSADVLQGETASARI